MSLTPRERPPGVRERRFDSAGQLAETLATEVHQQLATALRDRGVASLVVSGGRSPVPFFRKLSEARLPWEKVHVTLADERWVEPTDAGSNEGLVRRELLQGPAASATFIGLKNDAPTPQQGAETTWRRLGVIARPFDALILGMGEDGHTASLFPGSPGILQALDEKAEPACVGMSAPVAPNARMSLNLAALAQSRRAWLQIEGETKWSVYREAASLAVLTPAAEIPASRPVAAMLRLRSPGLQVFWAP
jgi:6-phosphogluconolactonase